MTDPLTAEERVTLNRLMRKEAEHRAQVRLTLDTLCESHFTSLHSADTIAEALVSDADRFVAALKPFCTKAS